MSDMSRMSQFYGNFSCDEFPVFTPIGSAGMSQEEQEEHWNRLTKLLDDDNRVVKLTIHWEDGE